MATLLLGAVGTAIGASIGGTFLGMTAAAIGGAVGSALGSAVDMWIVSALMPGQRYEGQRLDSLRLTSSTEGAVLPRVYGTVRMGGNLIWSTDFREEVTKTRQGGKGGGPSVTTTEYSYYASFAIGLCEGEITGIGRIWADGELLDLTDVTWRWYRGSETQNADPTIVAAMGSEATPAYRGTAYVVFEDMLLTNFGNRLPQLTFEVFRPLADEDTAEGLVRAVTLIPGTGEFAYSSQVVKTGESYINSNASEGFADLTMSLDRLEALAPEVESVSVVVSWFGNDLRCGECLIRPGVEQSSRDTDPLTWSVNGVSRGAAYLVSRDDDDRPVFGGTPSDQTVVETIKDLKARGYRVTFYPFMLMDIPASNTLPDPYSNGAASSGQAAFPWRGRITCSPAAGFTGTVDKTGAAATQVSDFFGAAEPGDFTVSDETVSWSGGADWGYRRMVLHYAHLCAAAGGVDAFLIGSELRGLTTIRSGASTYPAVAQLQDLAGDVRSIVGGATEISYAADWSEYFGHHASDGSGDVFFHLDPLWADSDIDFVGIDNYMPLSDWRDGWDHADAAAGAATIYDLDYLGSNVAGGEGFDWFYASDSDRASQLRTPITDGAHGKPWVFRYKDLISWWSNNHRNRPGGTESGGNTAWVPQSKPIVFTELGCPAVDRGTNQPNVFHDPKSSESFVPYFSRGWRDDTIQRAYLEATYSHWNAPANNPVSAVYGQRMVRVADCAAWTWDTRPYPHFPNLTEVWSDGGNWRLGHWLTGRLGAVSLRALVRDLCLAAGLPEDQFDVSGLHGAVEGYSITSIESPKTSMAMLARHFGFDACETEGLIRFVSRGQSPVLSITPDDMVPASTGADPFEIVRGQETELPQALKWQVSRNDEEFDSIVVEARRATVDSSRIGSETFPLVVPPEEVDRRCRRGLMEAWVGRERIAFSLPPSRLALDPTDVLLLDHDGRDYEFRVSQIADNTARVLEGVRQDRGVYDLPPSFKDSGRRSRLPRPVVYPAPAVVILDLPMLRDDQLGYRPLLAANASIWSGDLSVYWSEDPDDGYNVLTSFSSRASMGVLASPLAAGPLNRWDYANEMIVDMHYGTLTSVTDMELFDGANAFAVETAPGVFEVIQGRNVELVSPGRYRVTKLLRGQRGTDWAVVPEIDSGARVVVVDDNLVELPISMSHLGAEINYRVGPSKKSVSDSSFAQVTFAAQGVGLEPFSGVHVEQPYLRERTPGDLVIRWIRRSRLPAADLWSKGEIALGEELARYEVDIMNGPDVVRTLASLNDTAVTYSGSQQTTDWGAHLGVGDTLEIRIYQLAATVDRGAPYSVTLKF